MAHLNLVATLLLSVVFAASAGSLDLLGTTFDYAIIGSGKNAIVKFYAPWCGHCKRMAPDWEKLGDAFEASSSVVIGNVDCTLDDNKALCEKYEVRGYPTLKTFEGGVAKDYEGSRDYDGLETFVKETLEVLCQVATPAECSEKEAAFIAKVQGKTAAETQTQLDRLKGMAGKSMTSELKKWVGQRINILTQLAA